MRMKITELKKEMDAQFAAARERFAEVDGRFDQVDARFAQVDARFAQVDARFAQVDARFAQVDARFEQVDARFEQVDARFDRLEQRMVIEHETTRRYMDIVAEQFREYVKMLADGIGLNTDRLDRHETRITALEKLRSPTSPS